MPGDAFKRIDLHCHSEASNRAAEVVLNAIHCPECYSDPADVYAQAKRRGMDFVTITDHDCIDGALRIADRPDVLVGEELTCWFPEDRCKLHLLLWGIDQSQHERVQALAANIYNVAEYVERERIAHAVAHPIYRQNDKLERWHLERLLLLFKGFECLNGAHSRLHREAFEPLLDRMTPHQIIKLSERHALIPRWNEPWQKARTAGSDDHGLLNIGRTWTEIPADLARDSAGVLAAIRAGACRAGGEAGSSAKLAHTFYSVAVRYYGRHIMAPGAKPNLATQLLQTIVGERPAPTKSQIARLAVKAKLKHIAISWRGRLARVLRSDERGRGAHATGDHSAALLKRLFLISARMRIAEHPELRDAITQQLPPLGEHEEMFRFVSSINRDVTEGIAAAISKSIDDASFTGLFDSISAILAQQFVLLPYYFAVFHQNKERHLLREITGLQRPIDRAPMRIGLFTDTIDEINGVARFVRDIGAHAAQTGRSLTVHTCSAKPSFDAPWRRNFVPLLSRAFPYYPELRLALPPLLEILESADREQFDAIHVSTPGPMGLCGWLVSKMLRVPLLGTYHTDFPAYADTLTRDHRVVNGTITYMKWFYGDQMPAVLSRSKSYRFKIGDFGIAEDRIRNIVPGIKLDRFGAQHSDPNLWETLRVSEPSRLLYCGRVSAEKNLPMLVDAYKKLCAKRHPRDVALIVVGDGPYLAAMRGALADLPAYFLGTRGHEDLARLYASADLFVFPSRTDTLGQVVMEAQASGLPALVSEEGGPKEIIENGVSGLTLSGADASRWAEAIDELLNDEPRRCRMSRAAIARMSRFSLDATFESFWTAHADAIASLMPSESEQEIPALLSK